MKNAVLAILLFTITNCIVWLQLNLRYIDKRWEEWETLLIVITALPISFGFYYAWGYAILAFGGWWSARFVGFALSFFIFAPLTWYFLGEPFFTPKVMLCTILAFLILVVQTYVP